VKKSLGRFFTAFFGVLFYVKVWVLKLFLSGDIAIFWAGAVGMSSQHWVCHRDVSDLGLQKSNLSLASCRFEVTGVDGMSTEC